MNTQKIGTLGRHHMSNKPGSLPLIERLEVLEQEVAELRAALQGLPEQIAAYMDTAKDVLNTLETLQRQREDFYSQIAETREQLAEAREGIWNIEARRAPTQELLKRYEERKKQRPNLSLKSFLVEIGAGDRYRTLITARARHRNKGGGV
jgi:chromosome segregation ATPase